MVIGIDFDNTLVNTHKYTKKYMEIFAPKIESRDYHELNREELRSFLNKYFVKMTEELEALDGAKESLDKIKEMGYKIFIITARGTENLDYYVDIYSATKDAIKRLGFPYDDIYFNKKEKGKLCKDLGVTLFIDDKESNLDDAKKYGINAIRFLEPGETTSKHLSFTNWEDILSYIQKGDFNGN